MLTKEDGAIVWDRPAAVIARQVRAFSPWPGSYTHWRGKLLKILSAHALALKPATEAVPGTVTMTEEAGHPVLTVVTSSGLLAVQQLQLEGKKAMSTEEFLRGYAHIVGETLA